MYAHALRQTMTYFSQPVVASRLLAGERLISRIQDAGVRDDALLEIVRSAVAVTPAPDMTNRDEASAAACSMRRPAEGTRHVLHARATRRFGRRPGRDVTSPRRRQREPMVGHSSKEALICWWEGDHDRPLQPR
jgi:hypothetical protein